MGLSHWSSAPPSSSFCMHAFILLLWCGFLVTFVLGGNNETDRLALLEFKAKITHDPFGVMTSWNGSIHFCRWGGVTCGRRHQRVTMLDLRSLLSGTIPPPIFNMSSLIFFSVGVNQIQGHLPSDIESPKCQLIGFSSTNLIGVGSFRSVYKGILDQGRQMVAVKVLNLSCHGASKSFIVECEALRNTRHRNLVKVLISCSGIDYQGHDYKALEYEFMGNGNLDEWLHPTPRTNEALEEQRNLSLLKD
uniref:Protein kinase domain-containing protein n=1 Tax=Fagus sylvatica TaxID=28930 RepID=A0A2N9FYY0_FAGSY